MNSWIGAAIAVAAGFVIGSVASGIVRRQLDRPRRPEVLREVASPIAGLVFALLVVAGLITALGFVMPEALDEMPSDLIAFLPRAIAAAVVLILSSVAGTLAATGVSRSMRGVSGAAARAVPSAVKAALLGAGAILAAGQIGVDTTIINLASAALLFGLAGGAALLIGLGGRTVASEIAAGRAQRSLLQKGDVVLIGDLRGRVIDLHPTALELEVPGGDGASRRVFVPHSELLAGRFEREPG
ncbi:MAG: mechanosensitive ion channel family protein [Acidimicrobiia bacterium]|nr:mechanosensitive ion channel family protein [Acidimicrobiia bacterium]